MSGSAVCIRSYLTVWEADWQRSLLAEAGIPSCTDNCALVLWFWHYSQAVGGIKLYVDNAELDKAAAVLAQETRGAALSSESQPLIRSCPQCGAELVGDWDLCWLCPQALDASADTETDGQAAQDDSPRLILAVTAALLLTWTVVGYGLATATGLFAVILAACAAFGQLMAGADSTPRQEREHSAAEPSDPPRQIELTDAVALRAWRSAVMGLLWFPPLLLYTLYLLVRLGWRRFELSPAGRVHRWGAIACTLIAPLRWGGLVVFLAS